MVIDVLINIISGILNVLLLPLEAINIGINFFSKISFVTDFFRIVAFILPINNLLPLIFLTITIFTFRIVISIIKTIWDLLPIV